LVLYVADFRNNRIQRFQIGNPTATTAAGSGAPNTTSLYYPSSVILDADGYLFISDTYNQRLLGSGPFGFRCIVGCLGSPGPSAMHFSYPEGISFDSMGNIYVGDVENHRVQKVWIESNSCGKFSWESPSLHVK
jgi:hypothetical protein